MSTAIILKSSPENISKCGNLLQKGQLVAFPTETVYGLGANALDHSAVLKIYQTKQRPLTDPVIVHVANLSESLPLINPTPKELAIYTFLAETFWPGPLTLVVRHSSLIHPDLAAQTGFVGIRIPDHPLALALIKASKVPIAAPSANMFNHVSPTTAAHVFNDFFDKDVTILDDGNSTLGIESTVIKITEDSLYIYRLGSLPQTKIQSVLAQNPLTQNLKIEVVKKLAKENEDMICPGQFLKHYSPKINSFLLTSKIELTKFKSSEFNLAKCAIVDFGNLNQKMGAKSLAYFSLSKNFSLTEAMFNFYYFLREAENVNECQAIFIVDLNEVADKVVEGHQFLDCIFDKMFRACSGNYVLDDFTQE